MRQRIATSDERLSRLLDLHALLTGVSRAIGSALELDPVLRVVLDAMRSLVDFRGGTICLVDENGMVYVAASDPPVSPEVAAARVPVGAGLSGRVIASGEVVYSPDLDADERVDRALRRLGSNAGMRSYLAVPLVCMGRVIGVLQVDSERRDAFDAEDVRVLEGLAVQVAGAIESARRHEEVMRLEQLKSDFIARVSHELRTGLVDELLTVSGFEAGVISPRPVELHIVEILEDVRSAVGDNADRIAIDCDKDVTVVADPRLLRHAIGLLVDNALKYAGEADVTGAREPATGEVVIDVRDHGPGVPGFLGDRVFERFTRGDSNKPGMGLGLPLARILAGGCGGRLELLTPPDGGALFRLRLSP